MPHQYCLIRLQLSSLHGRPDCSCLFPFYMRYTRCDTVSTCPPQSSGLQVFQSEQGQSWAAKTHERQRLNRKVEPGGHEVDQQALCMLPPTRRMQAAVAVTRAPAWTISDRARTVAARAGKTELVVTGAELRLSARRGLETRGGDASPPCDTPSTGDSEVGTLHHVPSTTPTA